MNSMTLLHVIETRAQGNLKKKPHPRRAQSHSNHQLSPQSLPSISTNAKPIQHFNYEHFNISKTINNQSTAKTQATITHLILAALASMTSASPLAAKDAAAAAPSQELAIAAVPAATGEVTHLEVCIDGYFSGDCQNLANSEGELLYVISATSPIPETRQRERQRNWSAKGFRLTQLTIDNLYN